MTAQTFTPKCGSCGYVESHDPNCPRPPRTLVELAEAIEQTVKGTQFEPEFSDSEYLAIAVALRRASSSESVLPLAMPTAEEISAYRDLFRRELDKRMDPNHHSGSPSTEAHGVALRAFVEQRNKTEPRKAVPTLTKLGAWDGF